MEKQWVYVMFTKLGDGVFGREYLVYNPGDGKLFKYSNGRTLRAHDYDKPLLDQMALARKHYRPSGLIGNLLGVWQAQ